MHHNISSQRIQCNARGIDLILVGHTNMATVQIDIELPTPYI